MKPSLHAPLDDTGVSGRASVERPAMVLAFTYKAGIVGGIVGGTLGFCLKGRLGALIGAFIGIVLGAISEFCYTFTENLIDFFARVLSSQVNEERIRDFVRGEKTGEKEVVDLTAHPPQALTYIEEKAPEEDKIRNDEDELMGVQVDQRQPSTLAKTVKSVVAPFGRLSNWFSGKGYQWAGEGHAAEAHQPG